MQTIFISANDTGSGKTYVTAALAVHLLRRGQRVQVVKIVETGVTATTPAELTDTGFVKAFAAQHAPAHTDALHAVTLQTFSRPLAPVDAAQHDGQTLSFDALVTALSALPQDVDWLLVEGAGGLAVPLEAVQTTTGDHATSLPPVTNTRTHAPASVTPRDWADFAHAIHADATLLVVADRLGAINQARLLAAYATGRGLPQPGLWLNEAQPATSSDVRNSNANALLANAAAAPLLAIHNHGELWPQNVNASWLK